MGRDTYIVFRFVEFEFTQDNTRCTDINVATVVERVNSFNGNRFNAIFVFIFSSLLFSLAEYVICVVCKRSWNSWMSHTISIETWLVVLFFFLLPYRHSINCFHIFVSGLVCSIIMLSISCIMSPERINSLGSIPILLLLLLLWNEQFEKLTCKYSNGFRCYCCRQRKLRVLLCFLLKNGKTRKKTNRHECSFAIKFKMHKHIECMQYWTSFCARTSY